MHQGIKHLKLFQNTQKKPPTLRCIRNLYVTEYIYFNCMLIVVTQYNPITPVEIERYTQFTPQGSPGMAALMPLT